MSIYSGNNQSPFSGGKGKQLSGGIKKRKSRASNNRLKSRQSSNAVIRTGSSSVSKGATVFGMTNDGQGLIKSANSQALTSNSGLNPYDGLGIIAAGGDPVLAVSCSCGTDFATAVVAFAGKKNIKCILTIQGVEYEGVLDTDSFANRNYKIVFPQLTSLFSLTGGTSTGLKIEFTT
jgi:hypothetical protein